MKLLSLLVGAEVVTELVSFFSVLAHLRQGFRDRAARTAALLASPSTAFVLTAAPMPSGLADAANLLEGLRARRVPLALLLFNRAFTTEPVVAGDAAAALHAVRPAADRPAADRPAFGEQPLAPAVQAVPTLHGPLEPLAQRLAAVRRAAYDANQADLARMRAFARRVEGVPACMLPRALRELEDIRDLDGLLSGPRPLVNGL